MCRWPARGRAGRAAAVRVHETELPAGVYSRQVRAWNACGVSVWTAVQTVAVP